MYRHLSSSLLLAIITLLGVGLVQVYSSSFIFATESYGDSLYFFKRQLLFVVLALVILLASAQFPLKLIEQWGWLLWIVSSLMIVLTFIPGVGVRVGGAIRWIQLPWGFRIEPSELLKLSFPLLFASLISRDDNIFRKTHWPTWLALFIVPLAMLLKQPDFGSFVMIIAVGLGLLFCFGLRWRYIVASFVTMIPLFYFLVMTKDYRRARVMAFLDPWADPEQKGFQVIQSMLSFSSGELTGTGLGQGQGKLFFLPEAHTDFTMAVLGEEVGFIGFLIVMALYGFIILRSFQIGYKTKSTYRRAVALGMGITFGLNVFINVGVVLGLLPTKGMTLPFLSYGGSSLLALCLMMGLLLNVEKSLDNEDHFSFSSSPRGRSGLHLNR